MVVWSPRKPAPRVRKAWGLAIHGVVGLGSRGEHAMEVGFQTLSWANGVKVLLLPPADRCYYYPQVNDEWAFQIADRCQMLLARASWEDWSERREIVESFRHLHETDFRPPQR
ncbi:hypothetical protein M440DRAFT_1396561 [Trichoderma longibrachiatum ATCC 18648]|uniref:Uncharacterized protein n=1 Tax=Trichoderma longibrachiatum ATCC 18648 TaxID=983965 RepID=A0A2T4CIL2_TRILO|nr:hypothetical protein M440DRAFT_1396561 [Trichoderma longibrachiatum ATCC 18648]